MGWFDTVLNIGSTIGKVCGALQGGNNSAAHLGEAGSINNALGGLVFYYDTTVSGSPLTAANQTANQTTVVLTFLNNPLVGNLAQQVTLPYMSKIPIGPAFNTASSGGNENFTSTFTPPASNEGGGETAGLSHIVIHNLRRPGKIVYIQ